MPLVPPSTQLGHVDVVLQVQGLGAPQGQVYGRRELPVPHGVRLLTIDVSP
jgi:hypothetical protein